MSHLIELKRRIRSIKTTKKITHAMRLIAMSLYSKLEKKRITLDNYKTIIQKAFDDLSQQSNSWHNTTFFPEDILDSKPLFIVVSATKGFCGGLNNNLFKYLEMKFFVEEHQTPSFITIGKKADAYVNSNNLGPIVDTYIDLNSNNYPDIAKKIATHITENSYSSVQAYSALFQNFFKQKPHKSAIIPIREEAIEEDSDEEKDFIWEQDRIDILNEAAKKYLESNLTNLLFQALISEYAARFVAMDGATTNAENYLDSLTLQFNKLRQGLITREVSELSASL